MLEGDEGPQKERGDDHFAADRVCRRQGGVPSAADEAGEPPNAAGLSVCRLGLPAARPSGWLLAWSLAETRDGSRVGTCTVPSPDMQAVPRLCSCCTHAREALRRLLRSRTSCVGRWPQGQAMARDAVELLSSSSLNTRSTTLFARLCSCARACCRSFARQASRPDGNGRAHRAAAARALLLADGPCWLVLSWIARRSLIRSDGRWLNPEPWYRVVLAHRHAACRKLIEADRQEAWTFQSSVQFEGA